MQVDSVRAHHIVLCAWVREIVDLHIVLDALADEAEAVFPYDYRIHGSLAYKQLALQVFCLVDEARLGIALRIGFLRSSENCLTGKSAKTGGDNHQWRNVS